MTLDKPFRDEVHYLEELRNVLDPEQMDSDFDERYENAMLSCLVSKGRCARIVNGALRVPRGWKLVTEEEKNAEKNKSLDKGSQKSHRRGQYRFYSRNDIESLVHCYFVKKMTIMEAAKTNNFSRSSAHRHIQAYRARILYTSFGQLSLK